MPFDRNARAPKRIAIVGGGISGLAAAWLLKSRHHVVLYEAEQRLGGHARTVMAGKHGDQPVDTGFIVFNRANYPHLCQLFADLDVPIATSNMSFGASMQNGAFEYGLANMGALFATKRNLADPRFLRMLRDIMLFNKRAVSVATDGDMSIRDLLELLGTGAWFRDRYILPFSGAIWSTPSQNILDFPAQALVQFFQNHALLGYAGQHQWYTVKGGSVEYVSRMEQALTSAGVDLRKGARVTSIRRVTGGGEIRAEGGLADLFDEVILATHSDISLSLLADPTEAERSLLPALRYQSNRAVLHADANAMPRRKSVWSSWNYLEGTAGTQDSLGLTYWMNSLQPIPTDDQMFVTLNATETIRDELVYDEVSFAHPVYDLAASKARAALNAVNGTQRTWFCGAWMRNGFHEDGFTSAVDVVEAMALTEHPAPIAAE